MPPSSGQKSGVQCKTLILDRHSLRRSEPLEQVRNCVRDLREIRSDLKEVAWYPFD